MSDIYGIKNKTYQIWSRSNYAGIFVVQYCGKLVAAGVFGAGPTPNS
jgi:hypothetical protein